MQNILLDKPYKFVPPHPGKFWIRLMELILPAYLKRTWGLHHFEVRGAELLRESLAAGRGVLLAPNHCRPSDPTLLGVISRAARCELYIMASAHLFYQGGFQRWLLPRVGAFSIYREGLDRAALDMAITILERGDRPLVLFPEGVVSRTNDRLNTLQDGLSTIVRGAVKRRAAANKPGGVAIHPVAIRYFFHGDIASTVEPVLSEIEDRLTWLPVTGLSLEERLRKIGGALLSLKEIEHFNAPQPGTIPERIERLVDAMLAPVETELLKGPQKGHVVARVKKLRSAIMPDMIKGELSEEEKAKRWRQLAVAYYAQLISFYPADYLAPGAPPEHILETVERFEEDLTDLARIHQPMSVVVEVTPAKIVGDRSDEVENKGADINPFIEATLTRTIEQLKDQRPKLL